MTEAASKLREYQDELNNLTNKVKMYLFNNNCIELHHIDEKKIKIDLVVFFITSKIKFLTILIALI